MKLRRQLPTEAARIPAINSVRMKVINKTKTFSSLIDPSMDYQLYTFEDEKGTKLKTVLFDQTLANFEDIMEDQMHYEISDAQVRAIPGVDWEYPDDQVYELHFNINTHVKPVLVRTETDVPQYILLGSIPRFNSLGKRYDVLGIIIYMDVDCKRTKATGEEQDICELLIIDQSSEQIMILTASQEIATEKFQSLQYRGATFPVVGFTELRPSYRKGFSLEITPKTTISLNPAGEEADALRAWGETNKGLLIDKSCYVYKVRHPETECVITIVERLLQSKIKNTLQEERYWIRVQIETFLPNGLMLYLGCNKCNDRNNEDLGVAYNCNACFQKNVRSYPRLNLTFKAADETGTYVFTALTENAEILLKISATELYFMQPQEREDYLARATRELRSKTVYIEVAPTPCLSLNVDRVMLWVLEKVAFN